MSYATAIRDHWLEQKRLQKQANKSWRRKYIWGIGNLGFMLTVILVCNLYLFASAEVAQTHLELEQQWSAQLLDQNTHSLTIVANQKDYIGKANRYIRQLEETVLLQEEALHTEIDTDEIELEPTGDE